MYSKNLAKRLSGYIGVDNKSAWGPPARDMDFRALNGHSPVATTMLDFACESIPNATAFAAAPINWTATTIDAGIAANTLIANPSNGYLLITPGTTAASGWNLQGIKSDTYPKNLMQFITSGNATLSTSRDIYWGCRAAFSSTAAWDGSLFFGLANSDTSLVTVATGALNSSGGYGFSVDTVGTIALVKAASSLTTSSTISKYTVASLAHTSSSFRARDFHDYFLWAHTEVLATAGANAKSSISAYIDGQLVATFVGATMPAQSVSLYNSFSVLNGASAAQVTMAVANIVNGMPRYHLVDGGLIS